MDYPGKVITKTQVTPTQTSASGNWTLDDQAAAIKNNNWPVALVPNPISKSLRFNSADSAYLNRTPATASNRKTWTWSGWVKRSKLGTTYTNLFGVSNSGSNAGFNVLTFGSNGVVDTLGFQQWTSTYRTTTQVFRDVGGWLHIVCALDTTQATGADRVKLYVNGSQITAFSTSSDPTQNSDLLINSNVLHSLGRDIIQSVNFDGYLTEINFVDGQALTPSDFGLTNPQTGQWIPKKYTGTYGTNGFYLNFKDATSTTTLGYDYSGNANNWTTNNFSVTAGVGNDSLTDVPTPWVAYNTTGDVGGVVRGNYATWNPLLDWKTNGSAFTLSNGNLDVSEPSATTWGSVASTISMPSGKWYCEITPTAIGAAQYTYIGITATTSAAGFPGQTATSYSYRANGNKLNNDATGSGVAYGASYASNDIIGIAFDADAGSLTFYKNGASQGTAYTGISAGSYYFVVGDYATTQSSAFTANFGQRPFAYTPPAGFRSLCTTNLPATTIGFGLTNQADDYFNANLYTGTGSAFTLTGVGFQPDFGWFKGRNASSNHWLHDVVRGANPGLSSNSTAAEDTTAGQLTAFASDGYSLPNDTAGYLNFSGRTMVVWSWKAGGTGVSNTAGSITSTVSASTTAGVSIVTYTGNATSGATVGHGLGVAPNLIIVRNRTASAQNWQVYSSVLGATKRLFLDLTDAENTYIGAWNNTAPTSTVFSLGNATDVNGNTNNFVAYCFAAVPGYSAFGSYTGNGSADGPFVYLGFRLRYVLIKRTDAASAVGWFVWDTARGSSSGGNVVGYQLYPNLANAESSSSTNLDILSNGFKIRDTYQDFNASGGTFIYMAFAESPFQFANAR